METNCSGCGRHLRLPQCRIKSRNFCSRACANSHQHLTNGGWSPEEDAVLRQWYRAEGTACCRHLPGRNRKSSASRAERLGLTTIRGPAKTEAEWTERFWSYVNRTRPDECWPWIGNVSGHGYGTVRKNFGPGDNRVLSSHAVAHHLHTGTDPCGRYILHRCGNRLCCNPSHLYLGDAKQNAADREAHGRTAKGEDHCRAKLTDSLVLEMRRLATSGMRQSDVASAVGVPVHQARSAITGRTWKHLPGAVPGPGSAVPLLDEQTVIAMRELARQGMRQSDVARHFGVPYYLARCAIVGHTWKHLPGAVTGPGPGVGGPSKVTGEEVAEARRMARSGRSLLDIANFLHGKIGEAAIRLAISGCTWARVNQVEPPLDGWPCVWPS